MECWKHFHIEINFSNFFKRGKSFFQVTTASIKAIKSNLVCCGDLQDPLCFYACGYATDFEAVVQCTNYKLINLCSFAY